MPDWPTCRTNGCIGIRVESEQTCLGHAQPQVREAFLFALEPGANLDLRGTAIDPELLSQVLAALRPEDSRPPTVGDAQFISAQFSGDARFDRVRFTGVARFDGARFSGDTVFVGAQFTGAASFKSAQFVGDARFNGARFRRASFKEAQFNGAASFVGAHFTGASFSKAHFSAATQLGPLCASIVDLDNAVFDASAVIEVAAARLSGVGTRFERGATLRARYARIVLDEATFATSSSLAWAEAPLPSPSPADQPTLQPPSMPHQPRADRDQDINELPLAEGGLSSRPWLLSLRRVDTTNLVLTDLDLTWCLFRGARNLDKLRIQGPNRFATPPVGWRWTRRRTLAEEQLWRSARHPDESWAGPSQRAARWVTRRSGQPVQKVENVQQLADYAEHVESLYRALRKAKEDAKDEPGAADFYYGEMEMRRHAHGTPWAEKRLLWLYWVVAGYGLRGLRALASLLVVILGLAALLQLHGFQEHPPAPWYWGSVLSAAKSTLSLPVQEQLTPAGELLRILLRLTGPVLLGLALLSVRNRVKR
jgi:uncharacterized protein YjbI with pentapeptide repeats